MDSKSLSMMLSRPRCERSHVVEALYGDRNSFLAGGLAIVAASAITAIKSGETAIWIVTALIGLLTVIRLASFELFLANEHHAERHPTFWKRLYSTLGVIHLAVIGSWTTAVFWTTEDAFSELLSVMGCISFLIGTQGRNFSSLSIVRCQLLACVIPMLLAFYARSPSWAFTFSLFFVFFYFSVLNTSSRIRGMFQTAIETAAENWKLAHTDSLTGLPNRADMQNAIRMALQEDEPFALHFIDLDRFKRINDTLGHLSGDQLLRQIATSLTRIAAGKGIVSRYAGDEFVVLQLRRMDTRSPHELAQEIIDAICRPVVVNGITMQNGCSIGVACYPEDGRNFDAIAHVADMALFEAKTVGRGQVVHFTPDILDRAEHRLQIETDLRRAVDDGSLQLYFQPIVHNASLRISGCEALIRWNHPTRGQIPPIEFLPVAEESGLMSAITDFTFRKGCRVAATWPKTIGISINLSPSQLKRHDLIAMIAQEIRAAGLGPDRLEIEITENMLFEQEEGIVDKLHEIRALGIRLSLDDFGTGYSNLGQIALLPINKIKLDKRFLKGFGREERVSAVLKGTVQFIAPLGLEIVLEGLETEDQMMFAASQSGITHLQGYALGIPMPEQAIHDFLLSQKGMEAALTPSSTRARPHRRSQAGHSVNDN